MDKYIRFYNKRKLTENYMENFKNEIYPILKNYYGILEYLNLEYFCDSVYTSYSE